ncbi:restriction endonuclease subunit S [uncultured Neisseria sp.]|uniref:restriction endonuclease subunit S n=1 Tax=uncultured Neisseria sp. TaxID=237778 RepID=UPI0025E9298C|nr:restriction endonuclease subunit S [uncultured Neisseria sp.]
MDMQNKAKKLIEMIQTAPVEWKPLGGENGIAIIKTGQAVSKQKISNNVGSYPVINSGKEPLGYIDEWNTENDPIGITTRGAGVGSITWQEGRYFRGNLNYAVTIKNKTELDVRFLYHILLEFEQEIHALCTFTGIPALNASNLKKLLIPIPPLETQQRIVKILDKFTELEATLEATLEAELALRKRQYQYYRDFLLDFDNQIGGGIADGYKGRLKDVVWKTLGEVCENLDSMRKPITSNFRKAGNIPYYGASGIVDYVEDFILDGDYLLVSEDGANLLARKTPIAFSVSGKIWVNNHAHILKFRTYAERRFIEFYLNNIDISMYISGAAQPKLNKQNLNKIRIPIPPLPEQEKIVAILDKFDTLTHSVSEGLPHEIALRRKQYEYYREQLLAFPKAA